MNPYEQKRRWKYLLLAFAVVIALGSLLYTRFLVRGLERQERKNAQIWAASMRQLFSMDDNDFYNYVTSVRDSLSMPAIVVDEKGDFVFARELDSTRTWIQPSAENRQVGKKALKYDPPYFKAKLAYMASQHEPIRINLFSSQYWLVYYQDSVLLTELRIFPYVQLSVISVFLLMAYIAFNTSRKSEQDQVWVGLAKETAHQLGTPISSLMAWVELIKNKFSAEDDPLVAEMENDIKRLEIVADRFSKIGSKPKLELHNVYNVVKDYVDYFKVRVSNKIHFELTGDQAVEAGLNVPLFDWVLENLLKNAVNAIDESGNIRIDISAHPTKPQVYVDISDTGKGIPRSKFLTVFEPGYTTRKRGWGLGLSLTKRMIENYHNGHIFVKDSELGIGTTFRIILENQTSYE